MSSSPITSVAKIIMPPSERLQYDMIQVHNVFECAYDIILENLDQLPSDPRRRKNFLGYCKAWADCIDRHHTSEGMRSLTLRPLIWFVHTSCRGRRISIPESEDGLLQREEAARGHSQHARGNPGADQGLCGRSVVVRRRVDEVPDDRVQKAFRGSNLLQFLRSFRG
jgi:hypothetical protein